MKRPRAKRTYQLSGLLGCGLCGRRMQGTFNNGHEHYRCQFATEYALAKGIDHPKTVYLREDRVTAALDAWIATVFDEDNLETTCEAMAMAQQPDEGAAVRAEAARRKFADCDARLSKYRAAPEAGADALVVAGWMREVQAERLVAERELAGAGLAETPLTLGGGAPPGRRHPGRRRTPGAGGPCAQGPGLRRARRLRGV